jgi:TPR repeat protein
MPPAETEAETYLKRGRALIGDGDMAAAVMALREALRLDPTLLGARSSLGQALYGMGDLEGAVEQFQTVLRGRPDDVPARLHLATALMARHDWRAARGQLEQVLRLEPELVQAHYSLAVVRYTEGDLNGAIDAYRRVLAREPGHPDARYNLALTLKLAHRDVEAAPELRAAAEAGFPKAQYLLGAAYASGLGVERDRVRAIAWWFRAADHPVPEAAEALAQMRQLALGRARRPSAERDAAAQAFRDFRATLWGDFPDLTRTADDESVGAALLQQQRVADAVPVLIREASALSEPAQRLLETLYEEGAGPSLTPHDTRILRYLQGAAAEGQLRPRIELARIYGHGLGVPKDVGRAIALLKSTPHEDAQRLLQELSATSREVR